MTAVNFEDTVQPCGRVLVVDDDDTIRVMVERVLRREKFEVDSARDGCEAIEKLSRNDYGTVLLDLMMRASMVTACFDLSSQTAVRPSRRSSS